MVKVAATAPLRSADGGRGWRRTIPR